MLNIGKLAGARGDCRGHRPGGRACEVIAESFLRAARDDRLRGRRNLQVTLNLRKRIRENLRYGCTWSVAVSIASVTMWTVTVSVSFGC